MKLTGAFVFASFLGTAVMAYGSDIDIDNFSCPDSVNLTGTGFENSYISCPGSLGGEREDFFVYLNGPSDSVSTINSNPPAGAITGTFGPGITGYAGMAWGDTPTQTGTLPNLDFVGDSMLVQIQSDTGGTLLVFFGNLTNYDEFTATFAGSPSYSDLAARAVLIGLAPTKGDGQAILAERAIRDVQAHEFRPPKCPRKPEQH